MSWLISQPDRSCIAGLMRSQIEKKTCTKITGQQRLSHVDHDCGRQHLPHSWRAHGGYSTFKTNSSSLEGNRGKLWATHNLQLISVFQKRSHQLSGVFRQFNVASYISISWVGYSSVVKHLISHQEFWIWIPPVPCFGYNCLCWPMQEGVGITRECVYLTEQPACPVMLFTCLPLHWADNGKSWLGEFAYSQTSAIPADVCVCL